MLSPSSLAISFNIVQAQGARILCGCIEPGPVSSADFDSLQSVVLPGCSLAQKEDGTEDGDQVRGIACRCGNIHH
jgi:hypothetical protein